MFLVVSISGGLVGFLSNAAESPKSVPNQLAQTLPRAANYFMSYVLIKALTGSSSALLQPVTLCVQLISEYRDITPRQKWQTQYKFASIEWACLFPPLTNIAVIGIAFSVIAPLVLPFVSFALVLYWLVYRYNVLYVYNYDFESGGRFFVAALNQLFTGLYVMEICLIGHFFVTVNDEGNSNCLPHGIAMTGVLVLTVAYQIFTNRTFHSLTEFLPVCGDVYRDSLTTSQVGDGDRSVLCARPGGGETDEPLVIERSGAEEDDDHKVRLEDDALEPIVWIPKDGYGISEDEVRLTADSIKVSDDGACLDDEGKVEISTCPPEQNVPTFPRRSSLMAGGRRREVR
jgi:hypothetical protein